MWPLWRCWRTFYVSTNIALLQDIGEDDKCMTVNGTMLKYCDSQYTGNDAYATRSFRTSFSSPEKLRQQRNVHLSPAVGSLDSISINLLRTLWRAEWWNELFSVISNEYCTVSSSVPTKFTTGAYNNILLALDIFMQRFGLFIWL